MAEFLSTWISFATIGLGLILCILALYLKVTTRKEVKNPLADIRETAGGLRPSKPRVYVRINTSNMGQRPSFQRDPMTGTWDLNMRPRGPVGATIVLGDEVVEMISRSWLAHKAQQTAIEEKP